jgi:putative phosphoesterase
MIKKFNFTDQCLIGVISDTHGYVTDSVLQVFADTELIIHAGDIGEANVLQTLKNISPLVAVRGNMDFGKWAKPLLQEETLQIDGVTIQVIHDVQRLRVNAASVSVSAIIFGHSHRRLAREHDGIFYLNPGSASYPKYGDSASVALLRLHDGEFEPQFINLGD